VRLAIILLIASCAGEIPTAPGKTDAAVGDGRRLDSGSIVWVDAAGGDGGGVACAPAQPPPGDGHHNAGKNCMQGCHNHGFTLAGTLYTNATGNSALVGATMQITDANNQVLSLVTMSNGNFYTSTPVTLPLHIVGSECPVTTAMNAAASTGACNSCHVGATAQQMHL
jgi:hypothetical protein